MVSTVNADFDILEGVVQRLIRRVGQADQAFRLGDGPAVQTSLNSSGWSRRRSDSAIKRSPSAWLRRSLTCSRCDVFSADLIIRNSCGGGRFGGSLPAAPADHDPWRSAILLTAGDKTGQWKAWHERTIPHAEELYAVYLKERAVEESQ